MHTRTLGRELRVSAIGFGAMGMSQSYGPNPGDRTDMIAVLRGAVGRGATFFDTAEVYGPYINEELVGEALAPVRDQVVIATKFGWRIENGAPVGLDSRPERIRAVATASLERLKVETIDLFYQHRREPGGQPGPRRAHREARADQRRHTGTGRARLAARAAPVDRPDPRNAAPGARRGEHRRHPAAALRRRADGPQRTRRPGRSPGKPLQRASHQDMVSRGCLPKWQTDSQQPHRPSDDECEKPLAGGPTW
ncbi:hypothetical protein GCM10010517_44370 [Streptosporangium fragile]|uniref:NADP-dependent oxidoreductase domain-containing protein n=1 Tax=Streptosporangium fragile TaxID=46186 RepID=A0ABN3W392_9ACTN